MHVAWQAQYRRHMNQTCPEVRERFPKRCCILEHQIVRFAQVILRDSCSTSYDLASICVAGTILWTGKIAKRVGSAFHC